MMLAPNEMVNKRVAQLVKVCDRHPRQLTEPHPYCSSKGCWAGNDLQMTSSRVC